MYFNLSRFAINADGQVYANVSDCGRISLQTVRWMMRETNLAERALPPINATQCYLQCFFNF
jgi:hypothetical protein